MKPAWDKLMEEYADSTKSVVADVDCDGAGASLCEKMNIEGFPTLKYGEAGNLQDYQGGRDYEELLEFAQENLQPVCGPLNLDLCSSEKRTEIEKYQNMDPAELAALVEKLEKEEADAIAEWKGEIHKMREDYIQLKENYESQEKDLRTTGGLANMKAVKHFSSSSPSAHEEL